MTSQKHLERITDFFENLSKDNVGALADLYSQDAYFKDPFNEVRGLSEIIAIFEHMFAQVDAPGFKITQTIAQDNQAFLLWDFTFFMKGTTVPQHIHGGSFLRFDQEGKVEHHRDYWDAAEELYEKIPGVKYLMQFLKARVRS